MFKNTSKNCYRLIQTSQQNKEKKLQGLHRPLNKKKYCNMFTQTFLQNKTLWYVYADTSTKHGMPIDICFQSSFRTDLNKVRARCLLSEICERSLIQYLDYITVSNMNLWDCIAFMSGYCSFCSRSLITVPRILYIATLGQTLHIDLTLP